MIDIAEPAGTDTHPLACHRPRIPDAVVFDHLFAALVFGAGYERIADEAVSATTLRRRRDEWIHAGPFTELAALAVAAYDAMIGLDLDDLAVDGCITRAPCGGECAGRSPVDRGKGGLKRSQVCDGAGIALAALPAPTDRRDHQLLEDGHRASCPRCEQLGEFTDNRGGRSTRSFVVGVDGGGITESGSETYTTSRGT